MEEYIEKILHQYVQIFPYEEANKLPLALRGTYTFYWLIIGGYKVLAAEPFEKMTLVDLRKQHRQIEILTGQKCVLFLKNINYYTRDTLLEEGIPFIWENHQIYLPFIGILLDDQKGKKTIPCGRISFLTQKLLLCSLYQNWENVNVTKAAELMNVSKMSITRSFDELEALNVPYLNVKYRARNFTADTDKKAMWEQIRPILRNPIVKIYALKEQPERLFTLSGLSALSHYSLLNEPDCRYIAVAKKELSLIDFSLDKLSGVGDIPECIVQEVGYKIPFGDKKAIDPFSLMLGLSDDELQEPRISNSIDEMLEKYVW